MRGQEPPSTAQFYAHKDGDLDNAVHSGDDDGDVNLNDYDDDWGTAFS